jgi:radical SAM protein with 4Fe4S-binding SPASM domain
MLYRQKYRTTFRVFHEENRFAGYIKDFDTYRDKAVDSSGAIFLKALSRQPQSLDKLVTEISKTFSEVDLSTLRIDALDFYKLLEEDGFIVIGETISELEEKDPPFSYNSKKNNELISGNPLKQKSGWQLMLDELGGLTRILELQVEITNRCNEKCVHCYIPANSRKVSCDQDIQPELFYNLLSQCNEAGMVGLAISGGEAMLHEHFIEFVNKAIEYDFPVTIFSNLTALSDEIVAVLQSPLVILVRASIYSMSAEVHDSITGLKGSFEKTFNGLNKLISKNIPVEINCPIMKQNKDSFESVVNWGRENNIEVKADYNIFAPYDHSNSNLGVRCSIKELEDVIERSLQFDPDFAMALERSREKEVLRNHTCDELACGVCSYTYAMTPTGDIYPCTGWQDCVMGNIGNRPIMEIIHNSPTSKRLRSIKRKDFPECIACDSIDYCRMCLMKNALEDQNGDPLKVSEYFCQLGRLKHSIIERAVSRSYS